MTTHIFSLETFGFVDVLGLLTSADIEVVCSALLIVCAALPRDVQRFNSRLPQTPAAHSRTE